MYAYKTNKHRTYHIQVHREDTYDLVLGRESPDDFPLAMGNRSSIVFIVKKMTTVRLHQMLPRIIICLRRQSVGNCDETVIFYLYLERRTTQT